jgi:hypothetical protein
VKRLKSLLAAIFGLTLAACSTGGTLPVLTPLQRAEISSTAPADCGELPAFAAKWQDLLSLQDWRVSTSCARIPASEEAIGLSWPNPWTRQTVMTVDPSASDPELIVLHELLHAIFDTACTAKSELVEEQLTVSLSELLRRLERTP